MYFIWVFHYLFVIILFQGRVFYEQKIKEILPKVPAVDEEK